MKYFIYFVIAVVAVAVGAGFFVAGSPQEQRLRKLDDQRLADLQMIQNEIVNYWQSKAKLPSNLAALNDDLRGIKIPVDPETGAGYQYQIDSPLTFELCADFSRSSLAPATNLHTATTANPMMYESQNWQHGAGHVCFTRNIDKDFYPPKPNTQAK